MMTYDRPVYQKYHIQGVSHINPKQLKVVLGGNEHILVDIREKEETVTAKANLREHVYYLPMSGFMERFDELPVDKTFIIMCAHGIRSIQLCDWLIQSGYIKVLNLDGGFEVAREMGLL